MQVAPTPEPLKETVLPDVVPRGLLDELRHFPNGDTGFGDLDGLGEDDLGLHFLHPLLQREALLLFKKPLLFLVRPRPRRLRRIPEVRKRQDTVAARPTDGRNNLMHDPAFERLGLRLAGPEDERVQARF